MNYMDYPRAARAEELFKEGFNCAQAVFLAFNDLYNVDFETAAKLSAPFGGGMGRMREVCGSVSGMVFLAGFISPVRDTSDLGARTANYSLVQRLAGEFRKANGSIICRELLGLAKQETDNPQPSVRTPEYYKKRPCVELVGLAASIVAKEVAGTL